MTMIDCVHAFSMGSGFCERCDDSAQAVLNEGRRRIAALEAEVERLEEALQTIGNIPPQKFPRHADAEWCRTLVREMQNLASAAFYGEQP